MNQSPLKNNLSNFNNNNNNINDNNNQKYLNQNQNIDYANENKHDNLRNSNDYSNLNLQNSNNSSPFKNRNLNKYHEEKKDYNNNSNLNLSNNENGNGNGFGNSSGFGNLNPNPNPNSNSNTNSFYKNESNKKNTFGAYENIGDKNNNNQNEINENDSVYYNNNNRDSKKELRYLQETKSSRNLKRVFSGVDRNVQISRKSLQEIEEEQIKKKNAADKCLSLYENGKIKNEVNRLLAEKNQKIKEDMELKECTFFPKTNFNERFMGDKNVNNQVMKKLESNFFDRISSWQQKKEKKYNLNKILSYLIHILYLLFN
jgi:hypothetical protein